MGIAGEKTGFTEFQVVFSPFPGGIKRSFSIGLNNCIGRQRITLSLPIGELLPGRGNEKVRKIIDRPFGKQSNHRQGDPSECFGYNCADSELVSSADSRSDLVFGDWDDR
jgi:hypothetical protein